MGITELLTQAKENADAVKSLLDKANSHNRDLASVAETEIKKYFISRDEKQKKIDESIADMERKKQSIEASIKSMQQPLLDAIASGKAENVQKLQGRITELTAQTMSLEQQIKMLSEAVVHGDDDLYAAAEKKADIVFKDNEMLKELYNLIWEKAKELIEIWSQLKKATATWTALGPYTPGHKLRSYYNMKDDHAMTVKPPKPRFEGPRM